MPLKQTVIVDSGVWDLASFYETPVRFSLRFCDYSKWCITKIQDKNERKSLYSTLWRFEKMTWRMLQWTHRESGISIEKRGDKNYDWLISEIETFGIKNPTIWHFRFWSNCWRVFWFSSEGLFYILKIDAEWKVNH